MLSINRSKMLTIATLLNGLFLVAIVPSAQSRSVFGAQTARQTNQTLNETSVQSLSAANNDFTFKIFRQLSRDGNNDVMSPLSINTAFSILMNGAERETLEDMRRFLEVKNVSEFSINQGFKSLIQKYKSSPRPESPSVNTRPGATPIPLDPYGDNPAKLHVANRVFRSVNLTLLPNYERAVKEYFNADIQSADFVNNAVNETKKVNDWVSNATNHKITKIFDQIPSDTSFVIINAIHFKGQWFDGFYEGSTNKSDFYNNGVTPVKTDMMYNEDDYNRYDSQELDAQLLEMNYYGNGPVRSDLSFVVVLPHQRNGLTALKQKLNATSLQRAMDAMTFDNTKVYFPKFRVEAEYDLMRAITPKPLFLTDRAEFSRLSPEPNVVAEVKHKVYIDVNEKGTEAAAVTAIRAIPLSARFDPQPNVFRADHPFLYFIRDRSNGLILFMGQITKF